MLNGFKMKFIKIFLLTAGVILCCQVKTPAQELSLPDLINLSVKSPGYVDEFLFPRGFILDSTFADKEGHLDLFWIAEQEKCIGKRMEMKQLSVSDRKIEYFFSDQMEYQLFQKYLYRRGYFSDRIRKYDDKVCRGYHKFGVEIYIYLNEYNRLGVEPFSVSILTKV